MDIDPAVLAQVKIAIASFCGGAVRLFLRPAATLGKSVFLVFCCMVCGFYFTPIVMNIAGVTGGDWAGAVGAGLGLIGLSVARAALNLDWGAMIDKWMPQRRSD